MLSWPLWSCSLYNFKGGKRFWKIFEISPWGRPENWSARAKTLCGVSLISLLLQPLIASAVRDPFKLIVASRTSLTSLVLAKSNKDFSMAKAWSLLIWLKIRGEVSRIVSVCQYWRICSSSSYVLDDQEEKEESWGILLERVFQRRMPRFWGKKLRWKGRQGYTSWLMCGFWSFDVLLSFLSREVKRQRK